MSRKKKQADEPGGSNWMDTYGDLVTLLLTFFVMLFSMSTMDKQKWQSLASALSSDTTPSVVDNFADNQTVNQDQSVGAAGASATGSDTTVTQFSDLYNAISQYIAENGLSETVHVYDGDGYTFITFQNSIFFDGDSSVLKSGGKDMLDFLCGGFAPISDEIGEVRVMGHTAQTWEDVQQIESAIIFDRQLSVDRATQVVLYMQFEKVIDPSKFVAEGYGQYRPVVAHDGTEATRIKNRRVEIYIVEKGADELSLGEIYDQINTTDSTGK